MRRQPLPIDEHIGRIADVLRRTRALVLSAPPGTGKTTRVAPALVADGPLILLQPRRIAARALARRIAAEQGWQPGEEVGWQVRFERRFSPRTRLLVATEGILTARLQSDPLLSDFATVILDEFHERSLHADLALALVKEAVRARDDLRVVVMSATLETEALATYLGGCPVMRFEAPLHPVTIHYAAQPVAAAVEGLVERDESRGDILVFLPGLAEIRAVEGRLAGRVAARVLPLHGRLDADEQDRALAPCTQRKVILATNVAETSLTVPGVTAVVDSGLHKVSRYDPARGLDRLETERIAAASAAQRAGRAGRTAPGLALRLWDAREKLRPQGDPEILCVDLAAPVLEVLAWGGNPREFDWFQAPREDALEAALGLLARLGAVDREEKLTSLGEQLRRLPLHPRLGRVLLAGRGEWVVAAACAVLAEPRPLVRPEPITTSCDLLGLVDRVTRGSSLGRTANELGRTARGLLKADPSTEGAAHAALNAQHEEDLRRALYLGYADRVGRRRAPGSPRFLLCNGHGARLEATSGVRDAEFVVGLEVVAGARGAGSEARVRLASRVEPDWLTPTHSEVRHIFVEEGEKVRAVETDLLGALTLKERSVPVDPETAAGVLAGVLSERGLGTAAEEVVRRLAFAGLEVDVEGLLLEACRGRDTLPRVDLEGWLPYETQKELERLAPSSLEVPSGRRMRLEYRPDGGVACAVKLQEMFGLKESPSIGRQRQRVTLQLLAPNGRPVQVTGDLRSFWENTYPEVRKQLRGRYPRHPWPEDPWTALPTARTKPR